MLKILRFLIIFVVLSGLAWYGWNLMNQTEPANVYSGWLEGEEYRVSAEVAGKVTKMLVKEGQDVKANQPLVKLDDQSAQIQLRQAQANFSSAEAKSGDVRAGSRPQQIAQAQAQLKALEESLSGAQDSLNRAREIRQKDEQLAAQGGVTPDQLDQAKTAESTAQATVNSLKSQVQAALEQVRLLKAGATGYSISAASAQAQAALEQVKLAQVQAAKYTLTAPAAGRIDQIVLNQGEYASPGATLIKLVDTRNLTVTIYIPESQLNTVHVGQKVRIRDENGPAEQPGSITFIAAEGEFTPKNIQTREQRAAQVFAVKVTVGGKEIKFKPGQAVEVVLD